MDKEKHDFSEAVGKDVATLFKAIDKIEKRITALEKQLTKNKFGQLAVRQNKKIKEE